MHYYVHQNSHEIVQSIDRNMEKENLNDDEIIRTVIEMNTQKYYYDGSPPIVVYEIQQEKK